MTVARSLHVIGAAVVAAAMLLWVATGSEGFTRWPNERLERSDAPITPGESDLLAEAGFTDEAIASPMPNIESRFAFGLVPGGPDPRHLLSLATTILLVAVLSGSALLWSRRRGAHAALTTSRAL